MNRFAPRPEPRSAPRSTSPEPRSRRLAVAIGITAAATVLSACGLVAAFVPPLEVGDPLGVDGQAVTATLNDGGLSAQSTSHLEVTRSFDVSDLDENLRGFSLAGFHTNAGLQESVTLSVPTGSVAADAPATFTVTRAVVVGTLQDDVNGEVSFATDVELDLLFRQDDCGESACTYVYGGSAPLEDVLNVELTDRDDLERLVSILMLGGTETLNSGTFGVAIEIESETAIGGYTVDFTLTSTGSTIKLGG